MRAVMLNRRVGSLTRVHFGNDWIESSVSEIFKEDIMRFRILLTTEFEDDPMGIIKEGIPPQFHALRLHNGTVYRWNRPCYGVAGGKAHLRIENRVIPSGPTVLDEMANAAFFFGLMSAYGMRDDIRDHIAFDDVKSNFFAAARDGLKAQQTWLDGHHVPAGTLITETLAPLAREGLEASGIDGKDIDRYIGVIEQRCGAGQTGARWALSSYSQLRKEHSADETLRHLTAAMINNQQDNTPVHEWPVAQPQDSQDWRDSYRTLRQFMQTDLFTVQPDDLIDFAASLMEWKHLRHVPVEDADGHLLGLISHRSLLRVISQGLETNEPVPVTKIMKADPLHVPPDYRTVDAIRLMREKKLSCLPIVEKDKLVGVVTERDLLDVAANLLEEMLEDEH